MRYLPGLHYIMYSISQNPSNQICKMESLAKVAGEGGLAVQELVGSVKDTLTCNVCHEIMCQPYLLCCGHSFCLVCLQHWFKTSKTKTHSMSCPVCRGRVATIPSANLGLRNVYLAMVELLKAKDALEAARFERDAGSRYNVEADPFADIRFSPAQSFLDATDGVERCIHCHWELEDGECPNCGVGEDYTDESMDSEMDDDEVPDIDEDDEDDLSFIVRTPPRRIYTGPHADSWYATDPDFFDSDRMAEIDEGLTATATESESESEDDLDRMDRRAEEHARRSRTALDSEASEIDVDQEEDDEGIEVVGVRNLDGGDRTVQRRVITISDSE